MLRISGRTAEKKVFGQTDDAEEHSGFCEEPGTVRSGELHRPDPTPVFTGGPIEYAKVDEVRITCIVRADAIFTCKGILVNLVDPRKTPEGGAWFVPRGHECNRPLTVRHLFYRLYHGRHRDHHRCRLSLFQSNLSSIVRGNGDESSS